MNFVFEWNQRIKSPRRSYTEYTSAVGDRNAAAPPSKLFLIRFGQICLDLGKIKAKFGQIWSYMGKIKSYISKAFDHLRLWNIIKLN